jgi:hypothetical protein
MQYRTGLLSLFTLAATAVLAQGSTSTSVGTVRRPAGAEALLIVEINDPVEHVRYALDPMNKVVHKQAMSAPEPSAVLIERQPPRGTRNTIASAARTPAAPVVKASSGDPRPQTTVEKLGSQPMEGLLVAGVRRTTVWPAGSQGNDRPIAAGRETGRSPQLKVTVLTTENDPRHGEFSRKLVNLNRSEPDPGLTPRRLDGGRRTGGFRDPVVKNHQSARAA